MSAKSGNAPAWLFSFLDLAFLILIAVLLTSDPTADDTPSLASIDLPEIQRSSTRALETEPGRQWQLRVYPRLSVEDSTAFSLSALGTRAGSAAEAADQRLTAHELQGALLALRDQAANKPVLAPHRDSRSEDFLTALGFVQEVWPDQHVAAVKPRTPLPAVSAASGAIEIQ